MKKFFISAILAAVLVLPGMSFACGPSCNLANSAEAQAFQNMDISYGQDAGIQKVDQTTFKVEDTTAYAIDGKIYGSIHTNPDTLFFVGLNGDFTTTNTKALSVTKVDATIYAMNGSVKMAADAGASAASNYFSGAASVAGNSATIGQTQVFKYGPCGNLGYGVTTLTATGYTNVRAGK